MKGPGRRSGMRDRWARCASTILAALLTVAAYSGPPAKAAECAWIEFHGPITPLSQALLMRKLSRAQALGVKKIVIEIDSPGGMLGPSVEIAEHLAKLDWAHTTAYVPREAISGAAIMALGCDEIVLHPDARIGDAGPVIEGEDARFREAPDKIVSYLSRVVRDLASKTGKSPELAEAMVNKHLVLVRVQPQGGGRWKVVPKKEADQGGPWAAVEEIPESAAGKYLTLNGQSAHRYGLAAATVANEGELRERLKLTEEPVRLKQTGVDILILVLNSGFGTGVLLFVGLVALFIELSAPGTGVGGLIAGLCCVLFFWSHFLGGTAGWLEVILFLAGLVFLAMEIFVIPGFGVAGIGGILLIIASIVMASYQGHLPDSRWALAQAGTSVLAVLAALGGASVALLVLGPRLQAMPVFRRLVLAPPTADEAVAGNGDEAVGDGALVVVGDEGVADTPLRPAGRAIFGEEFVDVVADGRFIDAGKPVRVVQIQGNRVVVREVTSSSGSGGE